MSGTAHEFDMWLVNQARKQGIRIQEETRVLDIEVNDDWVKLNTGNGDYFAKVIVGADGANSVVRSSFTDNSCQSMALEFSTGPIKNKLAEAYFDFSLIPDNVQGYVWHFPSHENGKPSATRGIFVGVYFLGLDKI